MTNLSLKLEDLCIVCATEEAVERIVDTLDSTLGVIDDVTNEANFRGERLEREPLDVVLDAESDFIAVVKHNSAQTDAIWWDVVRDTANAASCEFQGVWIRWANIAQSLDLVCMEEDPEVDVAQLEDLAEVVEKALTTVETIQDRWIRVKQTVLPSRECRDDGSENPVPNLALELVEFTTDTVRTHLELTTAAETTQHQESG